MTKKFRIWGLVQDRLSPVFVLRVPVTLGKSNIATVVTASNLN